MSTIERGRILSERFLLLRLLGRGGLGEAWLAEDPERGEQIALKLWPSALGPETLDAIEARQREALHVQHPALTQPREFHRSDGHRFVCTRYFEGGNLQDLEAGEPQRLAGILAEIADALATAHANGHAHGNLHAANVLLDAAGAPHLVDFGSARTAEALQHAAQPADDLRALGELIETLCGGSGLAGKTTAAQGLRDVAARLREAPADSDASRTAAACAELIALAETQPAAAPGKAIQPAPVALSQGAPPAAPPPPRSYAAPGVSPALIAGIFGALLLLAIGVFTLLPGMVEREDPKPATESASAPAPARESATEAAQPGEPPATPWNPETTRSEFDEREAAWLERGVERWGAGPLASARQHRDAALQHLEAGQSAPAQARYEQSFRALDALDETAQQAIAEALAEADRALEFHDLAAAQHAYAGAQQITPNHPDIERALARLAVAEAVSGLLEEAARQEHAGELEAARASVTRALELDPARESVRLSLARLEAELDAQRFNREMSRGLRELAAGRSARAREAFAEAQALRPEARGPADGLAQAAELNRSATLRGFERNAERATAREDYDQALAQYRAALRVDPHLVFARAGERRSATLAGIDGALTKLLADRSRLQSREVQQEAAALLVRIDALPERGPRLAEGRQRLAEWLAVAGTPLPVVFQSDGQTQVTVYKVGKLGRFLQRELPLLPGTYTVVGSRDGYRDVRRSITVVTGQTLEPISIRCEEPL